MLHPREAPQQRQSHPPSVVRFLPAQLASGAGGCAAGGAVETRYQTKRPPAGVGGACGRAASRATVTAQPFGWLCQPGAIAPWQICGSKSFYLIISTLFRHYDMKSFVISDSLIKANTRVKYYTDTSGNIHPYELTCLTRAVYNTIDGYERLSTDDIHNVDYSEISESSCVDSTDNENPLDSVRRSLARARKNCRDIVTCNFDLSLFVTLTLDKLQVDRYNYSDVIRKLNSWLDNSVRRKGLRYLLIPEYHKDGAIHFHGIFSDSLEKVDSGHKRNGKVVYNIKFPLGFTTAIYIDGEESNRKIANYCLKYMTKTDNKVGGRWYLHGGKLCCPTCKYLNVSIDDIPGDEYDIAGVMKGKTIRDELTISKLLTQYNEVNYEV